MKEPEAGLSLRSLGWGRVPFFSYVFILLLIFSTPGCSREGSFFKAIEMKDYGALEKLLDSDPDLVNAVDDYGDTGINLAVEKYDLRLIKILVEAGSPMDYNGRRTGIPLVTVSCRGDFNMEILKYLLDSGADVNGQPQSRPSHAYGTPLQNAAARAQVETVKVLLSHGADVNMSSIPSNYFPNALHAALFPEPPAVEKRREIIKLLLDAGADPTVATAEGKSLAELSKIRFDGQNLFEASE